MKRTKVATGLIALLAAAGLGLGLTASADADTTHAAGKTATVMTQASPHYVARECNFRLVVEPAPSG